MNTANWKDIAELVGVAAIVGSLIFVGLQMKQSHEIALAEIYQARTATVVEADISTSSNILALTAFWKSAEGRMDEIEPLEDLAAFYRANADLMLFENSHYQYTLGFLPDEHWRRVRSNLKRSMQDPLYKGYIESIRFNMRDSFRAIIDEIDHELALESGA